MKWFACFVACLALLLFVGVCSPVNAQHCENGVCQLGAPVVAMPGPYFGGPVVLQPAPVFISPGFCHGPGGAAVPCSRSEIVYACNGSQCMPAPQCLPACRPVPHDWRANHNANRSGSIGISLNWNRSGSGRYASRWH
jgi:hypothetical protein